MQKNGGNVASYFLTPQGQVIDAVVGPVKADKLLEEAHWAVDHYQQARAASPKNIYGQAAIIALAHQALSGDRVHKLLAENSLVPLPMIQERVFEKLAGQKVSQDRSQVGLAAAVFEKAQQKKMPVLLVFTKAQAKPGQWDAATARLLGGLGMKPLAQPARNCALVVLPIDELPALTNLVKLPDYNMAERTTPTMVLAKSDGTQLAAISPSADPRQVARQLWDAVNQSRLDRAEALLASGKQREATGLLKLVKSSPQAGAFKELAVQRLAELPTVQTSRTVKPPATALRGPSPLTLGRLDLGDR